MVERCSRFQCGAPATARVAFDALGCMVWIDRFDAAGPLDVSARGAGALCTRHADRLVPPRGWAVQDRRGPDLRLWSERPPERPAVTRAEHAAGSRAAAPAPVAVLEPPLPFDDPEPHSRSGTEPHSRSGTEPHSRPGTEPHSRPGTEPVSRPGTRTEPDAAEEPDEIDRLLGTPSSPLLARAFNAAHTRQAG